MIVGGPGSGKTEVARSLEGCGAHIISTIASEGALLSASSGDKAKDATGGILRTVGRHGLLILKDFTTILSMPDRTTRPTILAALREIHDGKWVRTVGSEGGRTLTWEGHLGIVGCCTTAWDTAHSAISTMGDRFIVARVNGKDRDLLLEAGRQAMMNVGKEEDMRRELKVCVGDLLRDIMPESQPEPIPPDIEDIILRACRVASMARTPTDHDYRGKIIYSHDPEAPTRLAKSLKQLIRGAYIIGIGLCDSLNMVMRCARDCIPPIRLECLRYLSDREDQNVSQIANAIQRPWNAVDKAIEALTSARLLVVSYNESEGKGSRRIYNIRDGLDISSLWTEGISHTTDTPT